MPAFVYTSKYLRIDRSQWLLVLLMAIISAAAIFCTTNAYTSFDMAHRLYADTVHQDTLFHASIAAMIKNYGVTSTGLNGLVYTPYHVLSHVLFACISLLSGVAVIEVYGIAGWVLFAPILIFAIVACTVMLDKADQVYLPVAWGAASVLLVVFPFFLHRWMVWDSFFVSESYMISLGIFLLVLPMLFKKCLNIKDLLVVMIAAALMANAKASIGIIFFVLWVLRSVFLYKEQGGHDFATLAVISVAAGWSIFDSAHAVSGTVGFGFFPYMTIHSIFNTQLLETGKILFEGAAWDWRNVLLSIVAISSFFLLHFLLSWIVIIYAAWRKSCVPILKIPVILYSLGSILLGMSIISIFRMPGIYYFTSVSFFVALPFAVSIASRMFSRQRRLLQVTLCFGILIVVLQSGHNFVYSFTNTARNPEQHSELIDFLCELREGSALDKVYKPDKVILTINPVKSCTAQPFVFPAVSERPWIGVIDTGSDCLYRDYGYSSYGIVNGRQKVDANPVLLRGMEVFHLHLDHGGITVNHG